MLTQILTEEDLAYLQERFANFYDSVLKSWVVDWVDSPETRVKAQIEVRDYENYPKDTSVVWRQVVLVMENCNLFRLTDSDGDYYRVTPNGIYIIMEQKEQMLFGVDFGSFNETPKSIVELMSSPRCIVCPRLSWGIL